MKIEIYKDDAEQYRWRARSDNSRIVAVSGEGYQRRIDAFRGLAAVKRGFDAGMLEHAVEFWKLWDQTRKLRSTNTKRKSRERLSK